MKDIEAYLEKLKREAIDCEIIRDLAMDTKKRQIFAKLAQQLHKLAAEIEQEKNIG